MSESTDLIEQLRRSMRRWKALALAACSAWVLAALLAVAAVSRERVRVQQIERHIMRALADAQTAADSGQPR